MTPTDILEQLTSHITLGAAPKEELAWLASHSCVKDLNAGDILTKKGGPVEGMFVVLSGHVAIFVDRGAGRHKLMEWRGGAVAGLLPYSRLVSPPGDSVAQEPTKILVLPREQIQAMIQSCSEITSILVHAMLDRTRAFTSSDMHDEKMVSLGKLSAGLAHELNNPVAAIERCAALLEDKLGDVERATRALGGIQLTEEQLNVIDSVRALTASNETSGVRSPIQQAEREETIADWLTDHKLDDTITEGLADTGVTLEVLDELAKSVNGPALNAVVLWTSAGSSVKNLAKEIQEAAMRISGLVLAVKGFTHMDQAVVAGPVDLRAGLENTVAVLKSKAREKSATISINLDSDLPKVSGFAGELNQIWANLIDNALDAIPNSGTVEIRAIRQLQNVVVQVIDNGAGIPEQAKQRIFDPFFTTKPVGQGTGLGLDIVRRLISHNDGEIGVESNPGRTEFRVVLKVASV